MENYIIALGMYIILWVLVYKLSNLKKRNNGNEQAKTKDAINRRANHTVNPEFEGLYIPRSNPTIPPANEYEAHSIEDFVGDVYDMPFDLWVAKVEHDSFVEYMRMDLEQQGILMNDIDV